ncbi:hypothetical protein PUR50_24590, partial [Enterobacter hormaechei subsp. steigerwaltii]|nr:hypothetical protein [Enterobacter hormaechei subsp. steigerwaltii]
MKKMLRFVLLLIVAFGIAGGAGVWKVRQLAESQILIKDETIFTLKAGTGRQALGQQLYDDKEIEIDLAAAPMGVEIMAPPGM